MTVFQIVVIVQLGVIGFLLLGIYSRLVSMMHGHPAWMTAPVNQYGENFADAIQNGMARGLRGNQTWE